MPELPEVETIRRQLEPLVIGREIAEVDVIDPKWSDEQPPGELEERCRGRAIEAVERRGKYLLLRLAGERTLMMHLRMTGNLVHQGAVLGGGPRLYEDEQETIAPRHLRAVIVLDDGSELRFTDPRRFGHGVALSNTDADAHLDQRLGVEPLSAELTPEALLELAGRRTAPLKSFLLAQDRIAGIGNIYADEALHRAELHPLSPAGSMRIEHCEALREGIVEALEAGLANGGASMDDYLDLNGEPGTMQEEFLVHTREGRECPRCGEAIRRIVVSGRSTYFCPSCQVRLRKRPRPRKRAPGSASKPSSARRGRAQRKRLDSSEA